MYVNRIYGKRKPIVFLENTNECLIIEIMIPSIIVPITLDEVSNAISASLINNGAKISLFEKQLLEYVGCKYAILTFSGRTALYILLKAYNLEKGDEIILSAYNCESVVRLIMDMGYKPKFVDADKNTYNMSIDSLKANVNKNTKAIIALHMFGNPCEMTEIMEIAKDYNAVVIEDAAQSIGAEYNNKKIGSIADAGFFSLGEGKPLTTINGGIIVTENKEIANESMKIMENFNVFGLSKKFAVISKLLSYYLIKNPYSYGLLYNIIQSRRIKRWDKLKSCIDLDNFKFKYTDMQASIGITQLSNLESFNDCRINNAMFLMKNLKKIEGVHLPKIGKNCKPIFLRLPFWIENMTKDQRDDLIKKLHESGIDASVAYPHSMPKFFLNLNGFPNTEELVNKTITLPIHPYVKKPDIERMSFIIEQFFNYPVKNA